MTTLNPHQVLTHFNKTTLAKLVIELAHSEADISEDGFFNFRTAEAEEVFNLLMAAGSDLDDGFMNFVENAWEEDPTRQALAD